MRRLDRLISDISDASRLDAELARGDRDPVDVRKLLRALVDVANQVEREDGVTLRFKVEGSPKGAWMMLGHDSRLGQVFNNLIDNARTFSEQGGEVRVTLRRGRGPRRRRTAAARRLRDLRRRRRAGHSGPCRRADF